MDLGVRLARALVPALADHLAVADEDGTDDGVRMRRSAPALGQLERALEVRVAQTDRGGEPPVRRGRVGVGEDRAAGDEQARPGGPEPADRFLADAAVDLDRARDELAEPRDAVRAPRA